MDKDFAIADFEKRVKEEYDNYKSLNDAENFPIEELQRGFQGSLFGCLFTPFFTLFNPKWILRKEREKRNYENFEIKVQSLLSENGVRLAIRDNFEKIPKDEIVTEEVFVSVFTETLREDDLRRQFNIPLNPILFAMVGYGIFKVGVREFCRGSINE
ncbi:MAG: hypothetical protein WKF92_01740 [Pyrinomonadaceae bacterium]